MLSARSYLVLRSHSCNALCRPRFCHVSSHPHPARIGAFPNARVSNMAFMFSRSSDPSTLNSYPPVPFPIFSSTISPFLVVPHRCHPAFKKQHPGLEDRIRFAFTIVYIRSPGHFCIAYSSASRIKSLLTTWDSLRNTEQQTPR